MIMPFLSRRLQYVDACLSWSWPHMIMLFLSRRLQYVNACLVELAVCIGTSCHGTGRMFRPDLSWSCQ